jgi:hypothetical protein
MTDDATDPVVRVDVGAHRPAEVEVFAPDGAAAFVVVDIDVWTLTPAAARRLAEAITAAADRAEGR